ncbi:MAG: ThuA domain-containing protein [Bacteroidota bacterium]
MKRKWLIILALLFIVVGGAYAFLRKERKIDVLVFSKTEQFRHSSIEKGIETIQTLGNKYGFSVLATEDANVFKEKSLSNYNVIVFLNTTGDILNDAQQTEMQRFIQAGGGFVGVHSACDTEYDWPWYGELVGAYFDSHPLDPNVRKGDLKLLDPTHESVAHLAETWTREDEWYNFKNINPDNEVLVEIDETSYEGGNHGEEQHPMVWYKDFDGGRSYYIGLGHTEETYDEADFQKLLWGGISYAAGEGVPVDYNKATVTPEENRFSKTILTEVLYEPMELEILPNRDILFIERHGRVKRYDQAIDSIVIVAELEVFDGLEDGLLGMALDPDYESNHWLYLYYSPPGDEPIQHLSRFSYKDGELDLDSEIVMLKVDVQREQCCHSAGSIEFGPDGNLFLSLGDNTSPRATGYAPIDESDPTRSPWDAQKSSGNTQDLRGKILRIHPENDGTYTIPDGNLFDDPKQGRPEIYVMGCRNPYRISIDQRTGYLYWGDVGPDAGDPDEAFGPAGHDEVNQARAAGNFGWPYFIGDNKPYKEYDYKDSVSLAAFDPLKPINNSPNNTGSQELPPAQPAFIWYPYGQSPEFPDLGEGSRNAMAGPVFYHADFPASDKKFPEYYDGKFFAYDWMRGWIMAITMDEKGDLLRMERFLPSMSFNNIVDIVMGPDGDMYLLEYGSNWFAENEDARLVHLEYIAGNRKPVAQIAADKRVGATPLTVQFDASASKDFDGDSLSYVWTLGDQTSSEIQPSFTFDKAGAYTVQLSVTDPDGKSDQREVQIFAGNERPSIGWKMSGNQTFYNDNQTINYEVMVEDAEDGRLGAGIDPQAVAVTIDFLERGFDMTNIAQGHEAMAEASAFFVGQQLVANSDCRACHQLAEKSVGPSYEAIAAKYEMNDPVVGKLAGKIINGGNGSWGDAMMSAHPQLSTGEAEKMVRYILSLDEAGADIGRLPVQGPFRFTEHIGKGTEGTYVMTASYDDQGASGATSLTAREVKTLRNPLVQVESFDQKSPKVQNFDVTPDMAPGIEEAFTIVIGAAGNHIVFDQFDLTNIEEISIMALAFKPIMDGGILEFRLDSLDGEVLAKLDVKAKLSMSLEAEATNFKVDTDGIHDLYMVFKSFEGDAGENPLYALDWMQFKFGPNL